MKEETGALRRLGTMLDCSRNAVPSVETVKKWISITADMGYNALMLYTEDTYEITGEPYFGYGRGRYSKAELKELNAYAQARGMELLPCIQPLAHGDMYTRMEILKLIRGFLNRGTAVLIITANISDTLEISDRLLVVEGGTCTAAYEKHEFHRIVR